MYELLAIVIGAGFLLLCLYFSLGKRTSSGGVSITRPEESTVDGFGASRGSDFSYSGTSPFSTQPGVPVSLKENQHEADTLKEYAHDTDNDW